MKLTTEALQELESMASLIVHGRNVFNEIAAVIREQERQTCRAIEAHNKVTEMISRYLVACKGHTPDSWMDGFIECGAITYDHTYPTGFIAPVKL